MNLFEELNKVLLEDKNRQFIASIEAFTAFDHPQVFYSYGPHESPSGWTARRKDYLDAQGEYRKENIDNLLDDYFETNKVVRGAIEHLPIPLAIRGKWKKEWDKDFADKKGELKQQGAKEFRDAAYIQSRVDHSSTPVTRDEFFAIAKLNSSNTRLFIGKVAKGIEPLLARANLDPNRIATKYIIQYVENYVKKYIGGPIAGVDALNYYINQIVEEDLFDDLKYFVNHKMSDEHVGYDGGDIDRFIWNVIKNIEKYAFKEEDVYVGGACARCLGSKKVNGKICPECLGSGKPTYTSGACEKCLGSKKFEGGICPECKGIGKLKLKKPGQLMNILAVEPTSDSPTRRNLTDLPRHPNDSRPTVADIADEAIKTREERKEQGKAYHPEHSWIVITGYERSGYSGIKPKRRSDKTGRMLGTCPYCDGDKFVGLDKSRPCPECGGRGEDWAWYWASESQYWMEKSEGKVLNPFEKVYRAVWDALENDNGENWRPKAYDGFVREEPVEGNKNDPFQAGEVVKKNGYPLPKMYPFGAHERQEHAANTPLFTAVIKCDLSMGSYDRDLWRADYGVDKQGEEGTFQGLTKTIGKLLEEVGLGYQIEPINNRFLSGDEQEDTVRSEPLGTAYAIHVWDYVIEPGYLFRSATDQSLEREYMGPDQAPFEQLQLAIKVWEIAKYLDSIKEHEPRLWLALGLPSNANLNQFIEYEAPKDKRIQTGLRGLLKSGFMPSFIDQILAVIKDLKVDEDERFEGQNRIVVELQNVVEQYQKQGYSNREMLPHHIEQLFRTKTSLDTMFYSKCLGIPPEWNEEVTCDQCGGLGRIGDKDCEKCDGSGSSHAVTSERGKGRIERREGLSVRAKRLEEIWKKLPEGRFKNNQPHNALRMGIGLYWDVPNEYQKFLENKIWRLKEKDETGKDLWPEKPGYMESLRLKGAYDSQYSDEWMPVKYLETAASDIEHILAAVRDPSTNYELTTDDINELRIYFHELVAIIDKAKLKLRHPAFKKRIRRAEKAAKFWMNYGKTEEMYMRRSKSISDKLSEVAFDLGMGKLTEKKCLQDSECLEAFIFIEIQRLVLERGSINGMDPKYLWLRQNRYKSYLVIKDEIDTWVQQKAQIPGNFTLEKLVHPGTELPIEVLQRIYKSLHDFNEGDFEDERQELVERAFKSQSKNR